MNDEWRIAKDLEGNGCSTIPEFAWRTEGKHKNPHSK
jgi:hypothetical protein